MANDRDELMRLAERVEALATDWTSIEEAEKRDAIAADLRALAQRAPQNGAVPEELKYPQRATGCGPNFDYIEGWNACRAAMLAAAPAPEAERAKGEAVARVVRWGFALGSIAWTDYGRQSDLAEGTLLYTHPAPPPAGQPEGVEGPSWSDYWQRQGRWDLSHDYEQYERACEWMEARRLASAQRAGKDGA